MTWPLNAYQRKKNAFDSILKIVVWQNKLKRQKEVNPSFINAKH